MIQTEIKKIYGQLLAGRLPVSNANAYEVVFNHVYGLTGQKNLHAFVHVHKGFVYFFAVESAALTSSPVVNLPFAEYLPGMPKHQGDGVYTLVDEGFAASMWIEGSGLRLVCNSEDVLEESLRETELTVIPMRDGEGPFLRSMPQLVLGLSETLGRWVMRLSLTMIAFSALTAVGLQTAKVVSWSEVSTETDELVVERKLNETLKQLNVQQPLARQISRVQRVSATAVRAGGWIDSYLLTGERDESFEVVLPSWVSQDYLDSLGRDVVADLRDLEGVIVVKKNIKREKS